MNSGGACASLRLVIGTATLTLLTACAATGPYVLQLMPAPTVYQNEDFSPFSNDFNPESLPYRGMLYVTDRRPAGNGEPSDPADPYYVGKRGEGLRVGVASIQLGEGGFTWEEAKRVSMASERGEGYRLSVTGVDELGFLEPSIEPFIEAPDFPVADETFAALVNDKLAQSEQKDVYIYVHGYRVRFEYPVLVATELWHFLGYEGAFIAFSWPSTPSYLAYFADAEVAVVSARQLRILLEFLAGNTEVKRIHMLGYSQGTRTVMQALHMLALKYQDEDRESLLNRLRIGNVALVGSDIDRETMGMYLADGLMRVTERMTVYASAKDKALRISRRVLRRDRIGQLIPSDEITDELRGFLHATPEFEVINVTEAEDATAENGHRYFRKSPWVSSDLITSFRYGMTPGQRGLETLPEAPIWQFPADYPARLRSALDDVADGQPSPVPATAGQ